jgi:hypothetical protein
MTQESWCYKFTDYPPLPDHLVKYINNMFDDNGNCRDQKNKSYVFHPTHVVKDGVKKTSPGANWDRYNMSDELESWLRTNVVSNFVNCGIIVIKNTDRIVPHTDHTRPYVLIYYTDTGGENVQTTYYQEPGKSRVIEFFYPSQDVDRLTVLDQTIIPAHTWVLTHADILHGVAVMTGPRIGIQMDISHELLDKVRPHFVD